MDFFCGLSEISEASELKGVAGCEISKEANDKFDKLMGDDNIKGVTPEQQDRPKLDPVERENKFNKLFDIGDFFKKGIVKTERNLEQVEDFTDDKSDIKEQKGETNREPDCSEKREPNSTYEFYGNVYETDDNGQIYKKNGVIFRNTEYTVNGSTYKTDEFGRKISCDAKLEYTEEGGRNMKEQKESGGEERKEDDDGGHLIAKIFGGAEGEENLVPMRMTINRGDYKRMENEIAKALQEGKEVNLHIEIKYDWDSSRPSKIRAEYTIDGKNTVCEFDNVEGSTDLCDSVRDKICYEDYARIKSYIKDAQMDDKIVSITSVKIEYDENDEVTKVIVYYRDEIEGSKDWKECNPR